MPTSEKTAALIFLAVLASVYLLELFVVSAFALNRLTGKKRKNPLFRGPVLCLHVLAVIGVACFLYGLLIEPRWIEVNTIAIQTEKLKHAGFRIVHISDLHCDRKPRNEERLIQLVNAADPDIIFFTGDALSLHTSSTLPLFRETMSRLEARIAKLAVRGNVDIWHTPRFDLFGGTGFELLDCKSVRLQKHGEEIIVSGLRCDSPSAHRRLLENIPEHGFSIFLYHCSDLVEDLHDLNVDLYLCGHTHGGQVALPFYGALVTLSKFGKKYEAGMYTVNDTILYVNRGIGMEGGIAPRVRFLARPEITIFDIGPTNNPPD
ncbi:MAG: metallophosphoesterase [Planctomycetota bacterium]|jgi:predicted MPP superfamily phosphohydrolase